MGGTLRPLGRNAKKISDKKISEPVSESFQPWI
jgi:hypothetical protein